MYTSIFFPSRYYPPNSNTVFSPTSQPKPTPDPVTVLTLTEYQWTIVSTIVRTEVTGLFYPPDKIPPTFGDKPTTETQNLDKSPPLLAYFDE